MNALATWGVSALSTYGVPVLLVIAYAGSLGIPFPITPVIIAAGALTRAGLLDWRLALLACFLGASLADNSEYLLGRTAHHWLRNRFGQRFVWQQAQSTINRQGGWAILLTRFWLTPLAPAVNVIAGSRYSFGRFLFFDLLGELLWVILYGGLGYFFAAQWELVSQGVSGFTAASVLLVVVALVAIYFRSRRQPKKQIF